MKKIKHNLIIFIIAVMVMATFVGCGMSSSSGQNPAENTDAAAADSAVKIECVITVEDHCDAVSVQIPEGGSVYDALKETGADVSARNTGYGLYIEGINGRFEFDEGPTSGWVYTVNGERTSSSCDKFEVKAGDEIVWNYVDEL